MAPNVKLHFFPAQEINGSVLHEITDEDPFFKRLKLRPERDGLGGAELVLARGIGFAGFGSGTFNPEVFVRVIIPAYSDTVYYPWGFFLGKRQQIVVHVDEDGAEEFHFGGPGPKQYLDRSGLGIEQLTGTGWNLDLENGVWRWNESATVGRILNRIYQEDQARDDPALPDLTLGFDASDDSDGNPWTDDDLGGPDQFELPIGHSLLKALWDIDDVVELTSWIDLGTVATPKFELNVKEGLGDDKTGSSFGAGVALIREGVNIADRSLETEGVSLRKASHVIVEGKDGAWAEAVRPGFVSGNYVKYAKISYPRTNTPFWLEKAGIRWLKRQDYGEKELQVEILPGASDASGDYFPAPDRVLWLSNLISLDTSADGLTHSPLDIQPSEDQLVTGFELDTHTASDDASATAKARSWTVTVYLNRERPGSIAKAPDQRSAASGGGGCKCIQLCGRESIRTDGTWKALSLGYRDGGGSLVVVNAEPSGWKDPGFDDSAWDAANVQSDRGWAKLLNHPDAAAMRRQEEYLLRKEFWLTAEDIAGADAYFIYLFDDGGKVYVNGTEVASYNTPFSSSGTPVPEHETTIDRSNFVEGWNTVGIYAWNQNGGTNGTTPPGPTSAGLNMHVFTGLNLGNEAARCQHGHHASEVEYRNETSGLAASNVQAAIDELVANPPTVDYGEDADITDQDYDDVADAGVLDEVARADHLHGMPSAGGGAGLGAWTAYTPTVTAPTTNPVIASGNRKGFYKELDGETLALMIQINFVTGDTAGSGTWSISLPAGFTAAGIDAALAGRIHDAGSRFYVASGYISAGGTTLVVTHTETGNNGQVNQVSPMTWANGDQLWLTGVIKVS